MSGHLYKGIHPLFRSVGDSGQHQNHFKFKLFKRDAQPRDGGKAWEFPEDPFEDILGDPMDYPGSSAVLGDQVNFSWFGQSDRQTPEQESSWNYTQRYINQEPSQARHEERTWEFPDDPFEDILGNYADYAGGPVAFVGGDASSTQSSLHYLTGEQRGHHADMKRAPKYDWEETRKGGSVGEHREEKEWEFPDDPFEDILGDPADYPAVPLAFVGDFMNISQGRSL
eukprot:gnl/MRDRNA2_/MRDRNA2_216519_c0_seq1.p1 gnl/MRDRNA2_/MRDRNA2_216519_c0~~gnl/MRDRNA2_/MRDRNA2_216519_c0_seq1.p1  ORF type:complete len:234 (+),score=45.14 gnl/MRDRNA2_/MRDRNA2_216519_c0_seq1:26-703(+)